MDWQPLYTLTSKIRVAPSDKTCKDKGIKAPNKDGEAGHPSTQPVSAHTLTARKKGYLARKKGYLARNKGYLARNKGYLARNKGYLARK